MTRQAKYKSKYRGSRHPSNHGGRGRGSRSHNNDGTQMETGSRSGHSMIEGGANEFMGEPAEGYGTEAPGLQQGGKR